MPQGSIMSIYSEVLTNLLYEYKLNNESMVKFPLMVYAYELMVSTYSVKKLAQSKFKNMVESLSVIIHKEKDMGVNMMDRKITKLDLFANFLGLGQKWTIEFLNHFLDFLSKFDDPIDMTGNTSNITETNFSEIYEIIFNPELCELNSENRNNLLKMIDSIKYFDETQTYYLVCLEPVMNHYHYLWKKQKSIINSILGRMYITYGEDEHSKIEIWEFMMLMRHIEPTEFDEEDTKKLFFKHADVKSDLRQIPAMSLGRFSKLCLMNDYFNKDSEKVFHKKVRRLEEASNLEDFTHKYRAIYRS